MQLLYFKRLPIFRAATATELVFIAVIAFKWYVCALFHKILTILLFCHQTSRIATNHNEFIHDLAYDFYGKRLATCSSVRCVSFPLSC